MHVLAAGLAYQGIAVPLGVRTWPQNVPLAPGAYWTHLHGLLYDVQAAPAYRRTLHVANSSDHKHSPCRAHRIGTAR